MDIIKLLKALLEFLTAAVKGGFSVLSKQIHFIYTKLSETVDNEKLGVQRAVVLRVHNGGGNLSSSRPTYISVLYEESRKPLPQVRTSLQNVPADKHLMMLLQTLKLNKESIINVSELPEDAYLKYFYTTQGIQHIRMFFIKEKKGGFLWRETKEIHLLSLSTTEENVNLNSPAANESFARLTSDIKRNLK